MRRLALILVVLGAALAAGFYVFTQPGEPEELTAQVVATPVFVEGFKRADGSLSVEFPGDFGAHADFRSEWWYYTGNLDTAEGDHFGYELTFFRVSLMPPDQIIPRVSEWATGQVYMAHFALTDVAGEEFYAFQRYARGALDLAGANADPYRVWLEDWAVEQVGDGRYRLHAENEGLALDLELSDAKGPVLHGLDGYSQKGPQPGNASYYYSQTRLETHGTVRVRGDLFEVSGLSWKDHEYSTSVMSAGQVGWDWFAIQLDDGYEVMLYQIRRDDGSIDPFSSGTLIAPNGATTALAADDFTVQALGAWTSPHSAGKYPMGWRITVPAQGLDFELQPYLVDQELNLSTIYWEGAVRINGTHLGNPVKGSGYIELTGYAEPFNGDF